MRAGARIRRGASVYAGSWGRPGARIMDGAFVCDLGLARVQANIVG